MFASILIAVAALAQLNQIVIPLGKAPRVIEQPRAPIAQSGPLWALECRDSDDPDKPAPPVRIHGNAYYVGTCGASSVLITGSAGHVLIDGGTQADADLIAANIRELGFRVSDIRLILSGHEHFDHAGGIAKLQRLSGATVVASAAAARVLGSGQPSPDDPQAGLIEPFPPVLAGRIARNGEEVRLGDLMLTAIATPGHAAGSLSWRWVSCDGGVCRMIVYADVLAPSSNDGYRFSDHRETVAELRSSIARIADSPCEIIVTANPAASHLRDRFALGEPLLDEQACRAYAADMTSLLDDRLAKEAAH
ncbi:MAG: subclass B3 metallo-beta-lactamase [Sphingomicrobium sp.]